MLEVLSADWMIPVVVNLAVIVTAVVIRVESYSRGRNGPDVHGLKKTDSDNRWYQRTTR